jgi:hypothetical protein
MLRRSLFLVIGLLASGVLAGGCDGSDPLPLGDPHGRPLGEAAAAIVVSPDPTIAEACDEGVYIGICNTPGICPAPLASGSGVWSSGQLFPSAGNKPPLGSYCRYEWTPVGSAPPDMAALPAMGASPPADWLDPDCRVVAPLGQQTAVRDDVRFAMAAHARAQNGGITLPTGKAARSPVRVLVVDTSPTSPATPGVPVLGTDEHGYAMARLVQDLSCSPGQPCPVKVLTQLGLPRTKDGSADEIHGGHSGLLEDVAVAIEAGARSWHAIPKKIRPPMVINLSLGWSGDFGGPADEPQDVAEHSAPVRAVYDALAFASCAGALIVAAAGNDGGGPVRPNGAMYPAGWETLPAPTVAECDIMNGAGFAGWDGTGYAPLVHAVGAVDSEDWPVVNARAGAQPRLVAAGQSVSAPIPIGTVFGLPGEATQTVVADGGTAPRTGTSVAAAAVSAAAATVWSYAPTMQPEELMELVYTSGAGLGEPADFCAGETCESVRRLDLCAAVAAVCNATSARCYGPPSCTSIPAHGGSAFELPQHLALAVEALFAGAPLYAPAMDLDKPVVEPLCGGHSFGHVGFDLAKYPCIDRQYHADAAVPFALPQPGSQGDPDLPVAIFDDHDFGTWSTVDIYVSRLSTLDYALEQTTLIITQRDGQRSLYAIGASLDGTEETVRFAIDIEAPSSAVADVSLAFVTEAVPGERPATIISPVIIGTR